MPMKICLVLNFYGFFAGIPTQFKTPARGLDSELKTKDCVSEVSVISKDAFICFGFQITSSLETKRMKNVKLQ